jgi:hypothetical protein
VQEEKPKTPAEFYTCSYFSFLNKTLQNLIWFAASLPGEKGDCLGPKHFVDD